MLVERAQSLQAASSAICQISGVLQALAIQQRAAGREYRPPAKKRTASEQAQKPAKRQQVQQPEQQEQGNKPQGKVQVRHWCHHTYARCMQRAQLQ